MTTTTQHTRRAGTGDDRAATPRPIGPARHRLIVAVMVAAQMLIWLDNSILNIATRTLADPVHGLGASQAQLEWATSSYTLVFAAAMFAGGALVDRFGPRTTLVAGLVTFSAASVLAAFAGNAGQLIVARGFMGGGSALLMPATLSIIVRASTDANRTRAIAIWSSSGGAGVAIGPVAGGALLSHFWWGSVFLINVPVVVLCLLGVVAVVPRLRYQRHRALDPGGLLLSVAALGSLVYGIIEGGQQSWTSQRVLVPLAGGLVLLAVFVAVQRMASAPGLDVRLFAERRFAGGSLGLLFAFFGLAGQLFFCAFYLQGPRGLAPLPAGLVMTAAAVGIVLGNQVSPTVVRLLGTRWTVAVGMLTTIATYLSYLLFGPHTPVAWFELVLLAQGAGMGLVNAPVTTAMMAALPPDRSGAGSAINSAMRQVGATLGVAVIGSILSAAYHRAVSPALAGLPAADQDRARVSAEAARSVARAVGRPALVPAADRAFLHAMDVAAVWTSVLTLVGVGLVIWCLRPARKIRPAPFEPPTGASRVPQEEAGLTGKPAGM